jgi:hypothetical protein
MVVLAIFHIAIFVLAGIFLIEDFRKVYASGHPTSESSKSKGRG